MKIIGIFLVRCKDVEPQCENHDQNGQRECVEKRNRGNCWIFIHHF